MLHCAGQILTVDWLRRTGDVPEMWELPCGEGNHWRFQPERQGCILASTKGVKLHFFVCINSVSDYQVVQFEVSPIRSLTHSPIHSYIYIYIYVSCRVVSCRVASRRVASRRAAPRRAGPGRAGPGRAGPSRAEPSRAEPRRAEPSRAEPSRAAPRRAAPRLLILVVLLKLN